MPDTRTETSYNTTLLLLSTHASLSRFQLPPELFQKVRCANTMDAKPNAAPPPLIADEKGHRISLSNASGSNDSSFHIDPEVEKRVIRKCDWRVVPPTIIIFALSFIDR